MRARVPTPRAQEAKKLSSDQAKNYPQPHKLRNYYTPKDVCEHNTHDDCWVSLFNKVYDVTKLLHENNGKCECDPIVLAAGTDITHWFDEQTRAVSPTVLTILSPKLSLTPPLEPNSTCVLQADFCTFLPSVPTQTGRLTTSLFHGGKTIGILWAL